METQRLARAAGSKARGLIVLLVALLVVALAAPVAAETSSSARRRQAEARSRRARVASQINTLKASDRQLEGAVRTLDAHIRDEMARADAARQALRAAETGLASAEARLRQTEAELASRRNDVVARAVSAYTTPVGGTFGEIIESSDITEAARKQAFLEHINGDDRGLIERLKAVEEDLVIQREELARARTAAEVRRQQVATRLANLQSSRRAHARLRSALDARIRQFIAEADQLAAQEASLASFIRSREAARARAARNDVDAIADGGRVSGAGLIWPVRGTVTSGFGMRWGRLHAGIDIAAPTGTAIRAAKAGTVISSGYQGGYGNAVIVSHGGGFSTLYAHMSRRAAGDGQEVSQGEVIGYVGSTGHSTGPHLHFETRVNGTAVNPRRYL